MRKFKELDVKISIVTLILFGTAAIVNPSFLFAGYFTVGGWQLISMFVHQKNSWFVKKGSARQHYHLTVAGILLLSLAGLLVPALLMGIGFVMLVATPCMAIYYTVLCHHEVTVFMKRPLDSLK